MKDFFLKQTSLTSSWRTSIISCFSCHKFIGHIIDTSRVSSLILSSSYLLHVLLRFSNKATSPVKQNMNSLLDTDYHKVHRGPGECHGHIVPGRWKEENEERKRKRSKYKTYHYIWNNTVGLSWNPTLEPQWDAFHLMPTTQTVQIPNKEQELKMIWSLTWWNSTWENTSCLSHTRTF